MLPPHELVTMTTSLTRAAVPMVILLLLQALATDTHYVSSKSPAPRQYTPANRFPELQRVIERLDIDTRHHHPHHPHQTPLAPVPLPHHQQPYVGRVSPLVTDIVRPTPPPSTPWRVSTKQHPSRRYGQEYNGDRDNEEDDDNEEDTEDEEEEDEDEDEDDEDGDGYSGRDHHNGQSQLKGRPPWKSVTSTTTARSTTSAANTPAPMSSYSQFKWTAFGRRSNLDEFRNSRLNLNKKTTQDGEETKKAQAHSLRASRETVCKVPRPKVIRVRDLYPHTGKSYVPSCTVLHMCAADTGCCHADTHVCTARHTQRVELYFYTSILMGGTFLPTSGTTRYQHSSNAVEKLVFYNHTECSCQDIREEVMPRDMASTPAHHPQPHPQSHHQPLQMVAASAASASPAHHHQHLQHHLQYRQQQHQPYETPSTRSGGGVCHCPAEFSPRHLADDTCACDCFDKQRECLRLKKGKDYFTHHDKLCLEKKQCELPTCEYGSYNRLTGRCPRKHELNSAWGRHPTTSRRNPYAPYP